MNSHDLTLEQLDQLFKRLAPMAGFVNKMAARSRELGFPDDDELYTLTLAAAQAMEKLAMHVHYQAAEKARIRRPGF